MRRCTAPTLGIASNPHRLLVAVALMISVPCMVPRADATTGVGMGVVVAGRSVRPDFFRDGHRPSEDVVIAMGSGYDAKIHQRFAGSLRDAGFLGDLIVGVSGKDATDPAIVAVARRYRITLYPLKLRCSAGPSGRKKFCTIDGFFEDEAEDVPQPVSSLRYLFCQAWSSLYNDDSLIFAADYRDIVFQANPAPAFRKLIPRGLDHPRVLVVEEATELTIGMAGRGNQWNTRWIQTCFGKANGAKQQGLGDSKALGEPDELKRVRGEVVLCSGTTAGNSRGMRVYYAKMVAAFMRLNCQVGGGDQGIHNVLMRDLIRGRDDDSQGLEVIIDKQGKGVVNTLGAVLRLRTKLGDGESGVGPRDAEGFVLNDDGSRSAVVHQFDRDRKLSSWVKRKFMQTTID